MIREVMQPHPDRGPFFLGDEILVNLHFEFVGVMLQFLDVRLHAANEHPQRRDHDPEQCFDQDMDRVHSRNVQCEGIRIRRAFHELCEAVRAQCHSGFVSKNRKGFRDENAAFRVEFRIPFMK